MNNFSNSRKDRRQDVKTKFLNIAFPKKWVKRIIKDEWYTIYIFTQIWFGECIHDYLRLKICVVCVGSF